MDNYTVEKELDWGSEISQESSFILLPEGDYEFMLEKFERGRSKGSEKLPPCNMAVLTIRIYDNVSGESTSVIHNLILHTKMEWALSAFFASIGQKKKGESLKMNWTLVPNSRGRCTVGIREYNGNQYNEIKKFIPAYEVEKKAAYTPGSF